MPAGLSPVQKYYQLLQNRNIVCSVYITCSVSFWKTQSWKNFKFKTVSDTLSAFPCNQQGYNKNKK